MYQVTPAELIDIECIKAKHSKNPKHQVDANTYLGSQEDESYWWTTGSSEQKH